MLFFTACTLLYAPVAAHASDFGAETTTWTVMVYMAADAEPLLPWEEDINEMEASDRAEEIEVVALVDPFGFGNSMILEIAEDPSLDIVSPQVDDGGEVIPPYGEVSMSSPKTLSDFILFSAAHYPADRLALVLWGHSAGWYGLCADGTTIMSLPELGEALRDATQELGRRMDIVIVDSCSEGVVETMYELREYADWYVGSELSIPAQGLRYDLVLDSLSRDSTMSPEQWGALICEIHRVTLYFQSWPATMATFDLRALDGFVDSLEELSGYLEGYAGLYRGEMMGVLVQTAEVDLADAYLDVGDALERFASSSLPLEVRYLALETLRAYDGLVYEFKVYADPFEGSYDVVSNYTGAAVYAPSSDPADEPYWSVAFSDRGWADATATIRSDVTTIGISPEPDVEYGDSDGDGWMDEAILRWDMDCDWCSAWVFAQTPAGLQLMGSHESTDGNLTIAGYAGELLVSASAWKDGTAMSHHTMNILLSKDIEVRVRVVRGDGAVTEGVDVRIMTRGGPVELVPAGDAYTGTINVPADADYGELVSVQVVGRDGTVIAENRTYVQGEEVSLVVRVHGTTESQPGLELIIPSVLLAACAVAVVLYARARKGAPKA